MRFKQIKNYIPKNERVSVRYSSKSNICIVAPHGYDDINTGEISWLLSERLDCSSVVNWGWKRDKEADFNNSIANCNNVSHINNGIGYDEFLKPIIHIVNSRKRTFVFNIHGCSDESVKDKKNVDIVIGYGGTRLSQFISCDEWTRNLVHYNINGKTSLYCLFAHENSKFAGGSENNLNQYFARKYLNPNVKSLQFEIKASARQDVETLVSNLELAFRSFEQSMENYEEWKKSNEGWMKRFNYEEYFI